MYNVTKKIRQEIKVGQEIKLKKLNNLMKDLLNSKTNIFDYGREYWDNFTWDINSSENEGINVNFEILNEDCEDLEIEVKIIEISEF